MKTTLKILSILFISTFMITSCSDDDTNDQRLNFVGDYENDDYQVRIESASASLDTLLNVSTNSEIEIELVSDSTAEIEIDFKDFLQDGLNDALDPSSTVILSFDDDVTATVSSNEFEIDDFDFTITSDGEILPAEFIEGEGQMDNGVLLFSFRYSFSNTDSNNTAFISGEGVELELQ